MVFMGRLGGRNHSRFVKSVLLIGAGLLGLGVIGDWVLHASLRHVPAWEQTLIFDLEVLGLILIAASPILLGLVLWLGD